MCLLGHGSGFYKILLGVTSVWSDLDGLWSEEIRRRDRMALTMKPCSAQSIALTLSSSNQPVKGFESLTMFWLNSG